MNETCIEWLALTWVKRLGRVSFHNYCRLTGFLPDAPARASTPPPLPPTLRRKVQPFLDEARAAASEMIKRRIDIVCLGESGYASWLRRLRPPPPVFCVWGGLADATGLHSP